MSDELALQGRHAVVTGGSRGIGLAIARRLLGLGARVTLLGRQDSALQQAIAALQAPGRVHAESGDVSSRRDVERCFAGARAMQGTVDILVNNAGQAVAQRFDELEEDAWRQMLDVNLTGTFFCTQQALPDMRRGQWGRIVNVASTAGLIGYPQVSAYCAAKHGVIGLTRALALETARQGITVNAVCPGYTDTDIVREAAAGISRNTGVTEEEARARLARRNPQGRLVQPEDVAEAVAWLCQPGAASINGQAVPVDGGEVMAG